MDNSIYSLQNGFTFMRRSRVAAIQILFQIEFYEAKKSFDDISKEIFKLYEEDFSHKDKDDVLNKELVEKLAVAAINRRSEIITLLEPNLKDSWKVEELTLNLSLLLQIAIAEILVTDTDLPIIINEYIEIAKAFETVNEAKFVNSVIEQIGKEQRKKNK